MNAVIQRTRPLQLRGERPGEQHIGAGQQLQMQIRLLGDLFGHADRDEVQAHHEAEFGAEQYATGDRHGEFVAHHLGDWSPTTGAVPGGSSNGLVGTIIGLLSAV